MPSPMSSTNVSTGDTVTVDCQAGLVSIRLRPSYEAYCAGDGLWTNVGDCVARAFSPAQAMLSVFGDKTFSTRAVAHGTSVSMTLRYESVTARSIFECPELCRVDHRCHSFTFHEQGAAKKCYLHVSETHTVTPCRVQRTPTDRRRPT